MNENTLLEWLKGFLTGRPGRFAEDQLGLQAPLRRDVPLLGHSGIDHWAVVLQIATQSLGFKKCPNCSAAS